MSFFHSATCNLSKFLCRIFSGLLRNEFSVSNYKKFDHINNFSVNSNEISVSFDVVSFFISLPVDKALDLVSELLSSDEPSSSHTSLDISGIEHNFKFCLYSIISSFQANVWHSYVLLHLSSQCQHIYRLHGTH